MGEPNLRGLCRPAPQRRSAVRFTEQKTGAPKFCGWDAWYPKEMQSDPTPQVPDPREGADSRAIRQNAEPVKRNL
jgi:hypothetical protein